MRLLDLYCGGGGAGMGYDQAGFKVVGVDNKHQKDYPFEFFNADAFEILDNKEFIDLFDVIHASPVCKKYTSLSHLTGKEYPDDIPLLRKKLIATGKPYIIENVVGAPLENYVVWVHVWFESH